MLDLNDLHLFTVVAEKRGFAAAARALRTSKSKLSRRMSALQERLGVPLMQFSTRRFSLTQAGQEFYHHCLAVVTEAQAAQECIEFLRSEPQGTLRLSSSTSLAQAYLAPLLPEFMEKYPKVRVILDLTNRTIDLRENNYDLALRASLEIKDEAGMDIRVLTRGHMRLVASPQYLSRRSCPEVPQDLAKLDTLGTIRNFEQGDLSWEFVRDDGHVERVNLSPKLVCHDQRLILAATLKGVGIAQLPETLCGVALRDGSLVELLTSWRLSEGIIHLLFPSRRARIPSVRAFIDFMAKRIPEVVNEHIQTAVIA